MFEAEVYSNRRNQLMKDVESGIIVLFGNSLIPMNYLGNPYPFRQDSNFLYFVGINIPDLICTIDIDNGETVLFGNDITVEDAVWTGNQPTIQELALKSGINKSGSVAEMETFLKSSLDKKRIIHFLPPYPSERISRISTLLKVPGNSVREDASAELIKAVVKQRSVKSSAELLEMERILNTSTAKMHHLAMSMAKPNSFEYQISGAMLSIAAENNHTLAYETICTVNGEILHNHHKHNELKKGQLLLIDAGAANENNYATDITRTTPVGGKFSNKQKEIYEIVLKAEVESINSLKPGIKYRDIHMAAAKIIFDGLKEIGITKGDSEEAVALGAHALFFPHGLGHMIGLDVHDMEDLGEEYVGYDENTVRSDLFGTGFLRFARSLEEGFVLTVEPGIYFIPNLIEAWNANKKFEGFINYGLLKSYYDFGGIRIEDNVVITNQGQRILGNPIAKSISDVESMSS